MSSKWDQYIIDESPKFSKWDKYLEREEKEPRTTGFVKGAVKGISKLPQTLYDLATNQEALNSLLQALGFEPKESAMHKYLTGPMEEFVSKKLEEKSPTTETSRPFEEYGERYAQQAPFSPLGALLTAGAGQIAKEKGFGPIGQAVAEVGTGGLAGFAKNLATKGIIPPKNLKDLYNFGKTMGMSDKEMTPLMQSEGKIKWLSKLSQKGKRANEALKSSHAALQESYKDILESPVAQKALTPNQTLKFAQQVKKLTSTMPVDLREKLQKDAFELAKNGFTGSELMNFWKDIGYQVSQGNKELGILKGPITEALKDISPELGESFSKINNLYSRYYDIIKAMKPSLYTDLENGGKILSLLHSVLFFNPKALIGIGAFQGAKSFARETLINPKFQSLTKKMISALNSRKYSSANIIFHRMNDLIKKDAPELADKLEDLDFNDLKSSVKERKE